jgi:hypothetical protein
MMARVAARTLRWLAARRRRALDEVWRDPAAVQERALARLVETARDTEFGLTHGFQRIRSVAEYQARVPVREYLDFRPLWDRALRGARDVTWPGRAHHWAKTSGTTAGDKVIPVTREAFASHRKGGWDAFLVAVERAGAEHLLGGPMLFLGGSTTLAPIGDGARVGDLSGLVVRRLPPVIRSRYSPGPAAAAIPDWDTRMEAAAGLAARQDIRVLSGMPSWMLVFFERVARARAAAGRPVRDLGQCWPNVKIFIHGGVSFAPYASVFDEWMGRRLDRIQVYPASEGFVAVQTETKGGLTLMLDYDVFYEFIPVEDLGSLRPRRHTVADVELGRAYAVALTTPAGLWSYLLGDTVRFTARDPLRLAITGRTRHFVNAFGENVIVEEVERALIGACRRTEAEVVEFTVAPRYPSHDSPQGGHDWLVEFRVPPVEPEDFARVLDETLCALNTDYRTKRWRDVGMAAPRVIALPRGAFHAWMRGAGKLGDQHKVPRVSNARDLADRLLETAQSLGGATPLVEPAPTDPAFRV